MLGALKFLFKHGEKHAEVDLRLDGGDEKHAELKEEMKEVRAANAEDHDDIKDRITKSKEEMMEATGEIGIDVARILGQLNGEHRRG